MKKILFILFCCVLVLSITGCGSSKNDFEVGDKSDVQISDNGVSLSIKDGTLKNTGGTLVLKNSIDSTLFYDDVYEMEIRQDNEWHKINIEANFNGPLWELKENSQEDIELNWEHIYGKLVPGEYRIVKEVYFENEEDQKFYIAVEFEIKK